MVQSQNAFASASLEVVTFEPGGDKDLVIGPVRSRPASRGHPPTRPGAARSAVTRSCCLSTRGRPTRLRLTSGSHHICPTAQYAFLWTYITCLNYPERPDDQVREGSSPVCAVGIFSKRGLARTGQQQSRDVLVIGCV